MPQTRIEDLTVEELRRALLGLYRYRGVPDTAADIHDKKTLEVRVQANLEIVARVADVVISMTGEVTTSPLTPPPAPARVSPGLARMRATLGTEGTENLRQKVVGDGDAALEEASRRVDHLSEVNKDAGGDAALPSAQASGPGEPEGAAALGSAVARAIGMRDRSTPDLLKALSKELNPQAREILKKHLAQAQTRDAQEVKASVKAPPPRPAAPGETKTSRGKVSYAPEAVISLLVPAGTNPKRSTAAERFSKYVHGMTVAEYTAAIGGDAGQAGRDIAWDSSKGWVSVAEPMKSQA